MYQIFCHELEDMGNSLFTCFFFLFYLFSFSLVSSSFFFCLLVVVELRSSLLICCRLPLAGNPFVFCFYLNWNLCYLIRLAGTHKLSYAVGIIDLWDLRFDGSALICRRIGQTPCQAVSQFTVGPATPDYWSVARTKLVCTFVNLLLIRSWYSTPVLAD